jgi:hypothetical protein
MHPVFWGRMAYIYTSGTQVDKKAFLKAYQWSIIENAFVERCSKEMDVELGQNMYHLYTFVNVGADGAVFKKVVGSGFERFVCDPDTSLWSAEAVAVTYNMNGMECGTGVTTANVMALTLI